jgi:hypothetical protein
MWMVTVDISLGFLQTSLLLYRYQAMITSYKRRLIKGWFQEDASLCTRNLSPAVEKNATVAMKQRGHRQGEQHQAISATVTNTTS